MGSTPWRLPGYRVERLLGVGGFGEVWQGRSRSTDAAVALKRLPLNDPAQRKAALSEAAKLSALDHPHLIRLHQLIHVDGAIVLVLDLAGAGSLARLLAARGRLTPGETITALAPIGAALAYAHSSGVVHGDVTPANVLFTEIGLSLLADLGVARLLGDHAPVRTTHDYADPGVAEGYLPVPASDVFMLGAVALHALTGERPWVGEPPSETEPWLAHVCRRLHDAGVPEQMASIVSRTLALEPELRGTAADFALELRHSGQPVAVELTAGRSRVEPSLARLAAIAANRPFGAVGGTGSNGPVGSNGLVAADGGPTGPLPTGAALPLTHGVRVPSPLVPREPRHRSRVRTRALSTPISVLLVALALIAATIVWWPTSNAPAGPQAAPPPRRAVSTAPARSATPSAGRRSTTAPPARPTQRSTTAPRARPTQRSTTAPRARPTQRSTTAPPARPTQPVVPARLDIAGAQRALAELDATRSSAYAARDPRALERVYSSRPLLARDTALLMAIVPAGCGLRGVRTTYTDVRVVGQRRGEVIVRARAVLRRSTLVCGTTASGSAPGAGPSALRIELTRAGGGYVIAAQQAV